MSNSNYFKSVESFYEGLFKQNPNIMVLFDPDTLSYLDCNDAACSFYGHSYEDMLKLRVQDVVSITLEQIEEEVRLVLSGQKSRFYRYNRLINGQICDVEVHDTLITIGGKKLILAEITDITDSMIYAERIKEMNVLLEKSVMERSIQLEEKNAELEEINAVLEEEIEERNKAEESLKRENAFNQALLENTMDGIIACDSNGNITLFNDALRKLHGLDNSTEKINVFPSLRQKDGLTPLKSEENPLKLALAGKEVRNMEMTIYLENQPLKYISANARAFYGKSGEKLGAVVTSRDITKQVKEEKELLNLNSRLEAMVLDRTVQLEELNTELEEINISLQEEIFYRQQVEEDIKKLNAELESKVMQRTRELEEKNALLNSSNLLFSAILESSPDVIVFALDKNYCYSAYNKKHKDTMEHIWGKKIKTGMDMLTVIGNPEDRKRAKENFDRALAGESFSLTEEYGDQALSRLYWQDYYSPIVSSDGSVIGLTCFVLNITERKKAEDEILYLSYHDKLTGIYNRRFYEEEIRRLDTERNLPISIIIGDVNGLKLVNDAFGHQKGDEFLIKAAKAIQNACRPDDIVARWGGDEFVILLPKTESEEVEGILKRIRQMYSKEHVNSLCVSISFGWDTKKSADEDILTVLKNAEDLMYKQKVLENESMRGNAINAIIHTLHEKSPREEQHSKRVGEICQKIGEAMGLPDMEIRSLKTIGLLHDIGKIAIEEGILNKPEKLTEQEWNEIKRHPEIGFRIISSSYETRKLADDILAHHERWDGCGYPKGLKGEAIPRTARIITIADSYDAMISNRPYRNALSEEEMLSEIRNNAGTQFDPEIARIFVEKVLNKPWE